jgi:molybdopterin-guanine dinucleotide biosynthesis protein A
MSPTPAGIVLTGGRSRRFGRDKATFELDGETLATRAARLLASVCEPVIEVGDGTTAVPSVRETPAFSGPVAALLAGVDVVGMPAIVLGCDHAAMTLEVLARLAADPRETVVPVIDGRAQFVAAKYGAAAIECLRASSRSGDASFRSLCLDELDAIGSDYPAAAFADIDTPADLDREARR